MKKFLLLLVIVMLILVSCAQNVADQTGRVTFTTEISRGITAFIEYPTLLDKTWTLVAEKLDNGGTTGQGTYENFLLTDELDPFSVGSWRFTITDSTGKITGTTTVDVRAGNNTVALTVHSTATKGTLSVENCNFLLSKVGNVNYVDLYIDSERVNTGWVTSQLQSDDRDYYVLPTVTEQLSQGVHTVRLYYGTDNGGSSSETVSLRIVNGMTTHFSIGEQEGNLALNVSFDEVEPIVNN